MFEKLLTQSLTIDVLGKWLVKQQRLLSELNDEYLDEYLEAFAKIESLKFLKLKKSTLIIKDSKYV